MIKLNQGEKVKTDTLYAKVSEYILGKRANFHEDGLH